MTREELNKLMTKYFKKGGRCDSLCDAQDAHDRTNRETGETGQSPVECGHSHGLSHDELEGLYCVDRG